jgi:hypothetical protein
MKLIDIITEAQDLEELNLGTFSRPMGALSRLGNQVKAMVPVSNIRARAQGDLAAGRVANRYMDSYQQWLGVIGQPATHENLIAWLEQQGFDPAPAEQILARAVGPATIKPQVKPAVKTAAPVKKATPQVTPGAVPRTATRQRGTPKASAPVNRQRSIGDIYGRQGLGYRKPVAKQQRVTNPNLNAPLGDIYGRYNPYARNRNANLPNMGQYRRGMRSSIGGLHEATEIGNDLVSQAIMAAVRASQMPKKKPVAPAQPQQTTTVKKAQEGREFYSKFLDLDL